VRLVAIVSICWAPPVRFLSQSFATVSGQTYKLSFDLSANTGSDDTLAAKALNVSLNGGPVTTFTGPAHTRPIRLTSLRMRPPRRCPSPVQPPAILVRCSTMWPVACRTGTRTYAHAVGWSGPDRCRCQTSQKPSKPNRFCDANERELRSRSLSESHSGQRIIVASVEVIDA